MIQFSFEKVSGIGNREPYNNAAAHEELKSMMSRFDRLNIFFDIDEDGYEVIKVESTYVKRFAYQLNDKSANWLMTYLSTGKSEDFGVEPSEVQKSDQTNGNEYRKNMLKLSKRDIMDFNSSCAATLLYGSRLLAVIMFSKLN